MHDYGRMKEGAGVLLSRIRDDLGGWYMLDPEGWKSRWDLDAAIVSAHSDYLVDALIAVDIYPDSRDYTQNIISVSNTLVMLLRNNMHNTKYFYPWCFRSGMVVWGCGMVTIIGMTNLE